MLKFVDGNKHAEVARNFLYAYIPMVLGEKRRPLDVVSPYDFSPSYAHGPTEITDAFARKCIADNKDKPAWSCAENIVMRDAVEALLPPRSECSLI